jgi:hypothetical protein
VVDALSRVRTDLEDVLRECGTEIFTAQHPTRRFFENQNGDFIIYDLENSCVWVGTARPAEYPLRETQSGRWTLHLPGQIISGIFEPSTDLSQFSPIGILDVEMRPHAGPEIMTITTPEATLSVDEFRLKAVLDPSGQGSVSGDLSGSILDTTEEGGDEVSWNGSVSSSNARLVPNQGVIFKEATISLKIELGNTCGRQIEASGPWLFASKARYCQFQPKNST